MNTMTTETEAVANPTASWPYSGFWRRVAASLLDSLILIIPVALLGVFTFGIGGLVAILVYGAWFEASERQATPGKMVCGIRVETMNGKRLEFGTSLARQFLKLLGNLFSVITWLIFFLPAAFTEKKQGLHDMAVSTVVRHEPGKGAPVWVVLLLAGIVPFVMVVGILAAVAIPAYQDYVNRSKIAAAINSGTMLKIEVAEHFDKTGELPRELPAAGGAAYKSGRIEVPVVTLSPPGTIILTPRIENNQVKWTCSSDDIRKIWLPTSCRGD